MFRFLAWVFVCAHVGVRGVLREPTCLCVSGYVGVHRPCLRRCSHTHASLLFPLRCKQSHDSLGIPQSGPSLSFFSHSKTLSHSPDSLFLTLKSFIFRLLSQQGSGTERDYWRIKTFSLKSHVGHQRSIITHMNTQWLICSTFSHLMLALEIM